MATLKAGLFPVKKCTKCGKTKLWVPTYFYKRSNGTLYIHCKECDNKESRKYHREHKEELNKNSRIYWEEHKERLKIQNQNYRKENEVALKKQKKQYNKQNSEKQKVYQKEHRVRDKERIGKQRKEYYIKNKERLQKEKQIQHNTPVTFATYAHQLTIEEDPKENTGGILTVKCTYCGKYFIPTRSMLINRIAALTENGSRENRLYCSQGCKKACPIFHQSKWPKGFKPATSREVDPIIRQMCFKRDDYTCQKCEKTINEIEIHSHHIEGAVQMPLLANDVDNTITLCKPCHQWVHRQKGCTYYDMRCKR